MLSKRHFIKTTCAAALFAGCKKSEIAMKTADGLTKIKVGYIGITCEAPIFSAVENGFFKEEGLEVELVKCEWSKYKDVLALGGFDVTHHLIMMFLKPIEQGLDVKMTAGIHTGCLRVQAPRNGAIKTVQDLRGKRIGVPGMGTPPFIFANRVLGSNGIDPKTHYPQTPDDWQRIRLTCTYRGVALYEWGFWALLVDYGLSQECLQMIEDSMGFLAFYDQKVNAGVGFQTMGDFDKLPDYQTLRPGYETLSDALTRQVKAMGGRILLGHHVDAFDHDPADKRQLLVQAHIRSGATTTFVCPKLVLALPSLPLEMLAPRCPLLRDNAQTMADIRSVTSMPLTKINLYFEERWWFDRYQVAAGGSFTDLPMAQFYCYWPIAENDEKGPASMTIYCDFDRTTYWDELQAIGAPFAPLDGLAQPPHSQAASTFVVEQAMRQLAEFFGDAALPAPVLSTYVRWGSPRFGDGDHSWVVGARDDAVALRLRNPIRDQVYICGEAYSDEQAWVDGALRSTENVLQGCFGLPPYQQPA